MVTDVAHLPGGSLAQPQRVVVSTMRSVAPPAPLASQASMTSMTSTDRRGALVPGAACKAIWDLDGRWYAAEVVEKRGEDVWVVYFPEHDERAEVGLLAVKPFTTRAGA